MKIFKNTFGKEERLCSDKDIDLLYKSGSSFLQHPVVFYYISTVNTKCTKVLVSVSKKKFKKAVDRNLVKRRLREAYRLNKTILNSTFNIGLVYVASNILPYAEVEKAVKTGLEKIAGQSLSS